MPSDDERREAARRLRDCAKDKTECEMLSLNGSSAAIRWLISSGVFGDKKYHSGADLINLLADLIEPHRGSGGRTILCAHCENASWCGCEPGDDEGGCDFEPSVNEGEPPYNLYSLYEAVFRRRPRDEFAIEDDEVRELVNELLDICNAPGHDLIKACDASQGCRDTVACDPTGRGIDSVYDWCWERLEGADEAEDELYCSIMRAIEDYRHPERVTAHTVRAVDRDSLLALADEMDAYTKCDDERCGREMPPRVIHDFARRIREALGVVA